VNYSGWKKLPRMVWLLCKSKADEAGKNIVSRFLSTGDQRFQ